MKPKSASGVGRQPGELIFAWRRGDEALLRFWCALLLASGFFVALWFSVRIVVPVSIAPDRPRVEKAQLILVDGNSHPSLRRLLEARNLPVLGVEESVGDAPLVGDMLALLGLEEERGNELELYPAPELEPDLAWPELLESTPTLPVLPEVDEGAWPKIGKEALSWAVRVVAEGKLLEVLKPRTVAWESELPTERKSQWSLVFDEAGELAFAVPTGDLDEKSAVELRRVLEESFRAGEEVGQAVSGLVTVEFVQDGD